MKIKEVVDLIGVYEPVRVLNEELDEVLRCLAQDLPRELLSKNMKNLYADGSVVTIIIKA